MAKVVAGSKKSEGETLIVKNRRASFDYEIESSYEGGLVLVGSEVKSLRAGRVDVVDSFASVDNGELWLKQLTIAPFEAAKSFPHEPRRPRKVLLHASEIERIRKSLARDGLTLIPLRLYWKHGRVKVELGLGRGKKNYDKRADLTKKTADKEARSAMARGRKGD